MTPTLGTRPVSSVGLATNWRLSIVGSQTHPDSSYVHQKFLYGRLSICFSSCIFHSCIFHSRIFSAPIRFTINSLSRSHPKVKVIDYKRKSFYAGLQRTEKVAHILASDIRSVNKADIASTHKSATTHAGNVFVPGDLLTPK